MAAQADERTLFDNLALAAGRWLLAKARGISVFLTLEAQRADPSPHQQALVG